MEEGNVPFFVILIGIVGGIFAISVVILAFVVLQTLKLYA